MSAIDEARSLMQAGSIAAAERAYRQLLQHEPLHAEALNVVGLAALRAGRLTEAVELLQRAVQAHPRDAISQHHLARAHDALGDRVAARQHHRQAVMLRPDFYIARLHYAANLEQLDAAQADIQYSRSVRDAQQQRQWLNGESTPPPLRVLVEHAVSRVRHSRRARLDAILQPLIVRYGRQPLVRVQQCVRIYLGEEAPLFADTRQQPTFLYFPQLPPMPYFPASKFSWRDEFQEASRMIGAELEQLLPSASGREAVFTDNLVAQANLRGLRAAPEWNGYYFFRYGLRRDDNCTACPATAAALDKVPLCRIREHAPEAFFSVFSPGTHLLPHHGVTNTRAVAHLPLIVPADCALRVGGEVHVWRPGEVVVFDDTYAHEAWNRSEQTRVILIFDVWNPWLDEVERAAVTDLVAAIGDHRLAIDAA